jgi:hypothetical protein
LGELEFGAGGLGGVIVGVELLGVVGLGVELFGAGAFVPGVLGEGGVDDEPVAAGVLDEELELVEFVPFELELVELALVASAAVEVADAGTTAGVFDGDEFVDLPPPFDFASPDFAEEPGAVTGGGVQAGASSGIAGAVGVAGRGSSARRVPAAPARRARASPPVSAQRRARDTRTVDWSTRKKSITVGPAYSDALRNTSRPGRFTKQRHEWEGLIEILRQEGTRPKRGRASIRAIKSARNQECRLEGRGQDVERGVQILAPAKSVNTVPRGGLRLRGHRPCVKQ